MLCFKVLSLIWQIDGCSGVAGEAMEYSAELKPLYFETALATPQNSTNVKGGRVVNTRGLFCAIPAHDELWIEKLLHLGRFHFELRNP
jgi:hypothetical protein